MMKTLARVHPHPIAQSTWLRAAVCLGWLAMALVLRAETTNVPGALIHETDPRLPAKGPGWRLEKATIANTNLPRVLLIGDSILRGYSRMVVQSLQNKANVDLWLTPMWQSEQFNQALANVLAQGPYQVIHMNIGLHGWPAGRIKDEEYEPLTRAFLKVIRDKCPRAKLIWASTTPFLNKTNLQELDPAINPILVKRNQIDARIMTEAGVPINDFYSLLVDKKEWNGGDGAHWKQPAYRLLAKAAANSILRELAAMPARTPASEPTNAKEAAKQQQQKPGSGVRLTDFHSNGAMCSPTRASLMTGRYQQRCASVPDEELSPVYQAQRKANPAQRWAWGISTNEVTMWLLYAANFSLDQNNQPHSDNPPGSHYAMTFQKIELQKIKSP